MSDNLLKFSKALFGFDAVVQRVDADGWNRQSPCPEWTARDVVGHNIMMQQMIGAFARGETPPGVTDTDELVGDDPRASWNEARDQVPVDAVFIAACSFLFAGCTSYTGYTGI